MLQDVPDDHLIEIGGRVLCLVQTLPDSNDGPRVDARGGRGAHLEAVCLEAATSQARKQNTPSAADVEHSRARLQTARQGADVPRSHQSHQCLDERNKLRPCDSVVTRRIKLRDEFGIGPRVHATKSALRAVDDPQANPWQREAGPCPFALANGTRVNGYQMTLGHR